MVRSSVWYKSFLPPCAPPGSGLIKKPSGKKSAILVRLPSPYPFCPPLSPFPPLSSS
ncbi:hypothetical protein BDZ91DRAFT_257633 [Kalaharituber pfeilii]|nr:hypothetical protein BDZ91DRAFT_257633 [Kalaharituber pfeilii]